jgi:glycosyltransferase involved in cell wall biosynthesis
MNNENTLAAVAISFNEERDLPSFIANVAPYVDEIIIVDDGSTDRTKEIASSHDKVKFITSVRSVGEYYSDQRNKGIKAASSAWLLHMDIDERISKAFITEVKHVIQSHNYDAYRFRRLNYFLHRPMKGGGWSDWNLVHLAKRECLSFTGMFHEKIALSVSDERVGQLQSKMIHLNDESYTERLRKSNNYLEESVKHIESSKRNISIWSISKAVLKEFLVKFFYKGGYKDGAVGFIWALHCCTATFRAYTVVWDRQNRLEREELEAEIQKGFND